MNNLVYFRNVVNNSELNIHLNYFGQVESQFVSDINIIVFHFVVQNQLFYPLLHKCCSEIYGNICKVEGKVSGLELKNEKQ